MKVCKVGRCQCCLCVANVSEQIKGKPNKATYKKRARTRACVGGGWCVRERGRERAREREEREREREGD